MNTHRISRMLSLVMLCFASIVGTAHAQQLPSATSLFDVIHYDAHIKPLIAEQRVVGEVRIHYASRINALDSLEFDCGDLAIDDVREGNQPLRFSMTEGRVRIHLLQPAGMDQERTIDIKYHGDPQSGMYFIPEEQQVYTAFSTSQWMVCIDAPDDRATLRLELLLPDSLHAVANGRCTETQHRETGIISQIWSQETPVPTYSFGFAAGRFNEVIDSSGGVQLRYLASHFTDDELRRIFRDTRDMLNFFEEYAGVAYNDSTYTQVLAAGGVAQEMSGFCAMGKRYGNGVLNDEHEIWLAAHEFAHQWWGNMVTCLNWNHFWLNEGMASFMAAAYKGHRFGEQEYLREIGLFRQRYERVRDAGHDKPLANLDWSHPTGDDRTLVYYKGAYVLHLLHEKMGDAAFRDGIRRYTRDNWGKSVTTADFQRAMESAGGKSLQAFFARWMYGSEKSDG